MAVEKIVLAIQRQKELDEDGIHRFNGYLDTFDDGPQSECGRVEITKKTYREAMGIFIEWGRAHPKASLFITRLDQLPNPLVLKLEPELAKLLREDPVSFLRQMDPLEGRALKLDVSIPTRTNREHPDIIKHNPLPAGYDTLAEAFGDSVYIRCRDNLFESPLSGRWVEEWVLGVPVNKVSAHWAEVKTGELLLCVDSSRFFLPRAWNNNGPWIGCEELQKKYDEFKKEKEECTRTLKAGM